MSHSFRLSALLCVPLLSACGTVGLEALGDPDHPASSASSAAPGGTDDDAAPGGTGAGGDSPADGGGGTDGALECTYDHLSVSLEQATQDNSVPGQPLFAYQARTADTPPFDALQILSYQAAPYFGPDQPGSYTLDGLNYADCGLCVLLLADCNNSYQCEQVFFVSEGTLDILAINTHGGPFRAELRDAVFEEVTIEPGTYTSTPVQGGEGWCLDSVFIDVMTEVMN
jgi:hypothetical protein